MGFVSLGKQALEVRFKLCRGGNGDDADAEVVDIHLLKALTVLAERLVNDDLFDEFVYKFRRQLGKTRDFAHLCDEHPDIVDLLLLAVQLGFKNFDTLLKLRLFSLVFPVQHVELLVVYPSAHVVLICPDKQCVDIGNAALRFLKLALFLCDVLL